MTTAQLFNWADMKDQVGRLKVDRCLFATSDPTGVIHSGSSSRLVIADNRDKYAPKNLFDGRGNSAWAEGVEGDGIGQQVWFTVDRGTDRLVITNGFAGSTALFQKNNRVKRLEASLWVGITCDYENYEEERWFWARSASGELSLALADTAKPQSVALPFDWGALREEYRTSERYYDEYATYWTEYIVCLEIREVYHGTSGGDTCLTEISWTVPRAVAGPGGRRAADLGGWWKAEAGAKWDVLHLELHFGHSDTFSAWRWDRSWPTSQAYEQSGSVVLADGLWHVGDGRLTLESESGKLWIYTGGKLSGDRLYLTAEDGHQEIYIRPTEGEMLSFDSFGI